MTELNSTITTKVATSIDNSLNSATQELLIGLYKKFPTLGHSFYNFTYGQILFALLIFIFIWLIRPLLIKALITILLKIAKKTDTKYDDLIVKNLHKPLRFTFLLIAIYAFISILYLQTTTIYLILESLVIYNFFWIIWAILHAIEGIIYKATASIYKDLSSELSHFIIRMIKLLVWILGASSILTLWGINVTALLASLGLGGLAFALAAKDTAANLFGSIAILIDKSIKIGDWIKVNDVEGTVEDIGMRTTKIRTFQKSLVVVPNQIVANSNIENFSRRNSRRIKMHIGLTYDTTNTQIEAIIKDIKNMLLNHSGIDKESTLMVNFVNFGDSAQEILVYAFTNTANWQEYLNTKEDVQYKISKIVLKNGSNFAFPTQSIYVENLSEVGTLKQN